MAEDNVKKQILEAIAGLLTAAFGLIAALAWNEAIKEHLEGMDWKYLKIKSYKT